MIITREMIPKGIYRDFLDEIVKYLNNQWGFEWNFAIKVALMLLYATVNGIFWKINSGFRSPAKQKAMLKRWLAGDRAGLFARPAVNSKHSRMDELTGAPAAIATDIGTSLKDLKTLGAWAPYFGLKWGGHFSNKDDVHFYV